MGGVTIDIERAKNPAVRISGISVPHKSSPVIILPKKERSGGA